MAIIILLIALFIAYRRRCGVNTGIDPKHIRVLLRASAVLHANYAAGYLWALSDIATTSEIEAMSGINWKRFRDAIIDIQDMVTKRLVRLYQFSRGWH